ncbi:MAG: pyridoxal phosphate-dependent aminotransferase [Candidatus Eisenbacteria bacterium]|uniref:Pyridoxal phosphate-dependent aminotransferase n=1 Tax=Eiseniibacteriota bacterium TaxID=2212470 RepID=A0A956N9N2_UNCEI|nr:pyridoxal phosphate-dependent aminotransferase [Candidatus Eisenbacteria bacterium]MCB9462316.1 pyridoxal phosphate-dependent aminotransferase [Candidatus Eisenbacteria bacterium]
MAFASWMSRLGTETAFEVLAKARALEAQGRQIVHLEIGEPDFDTPKFICDAAVDALRSGYTHYGPSAGLPEVREAISAYVTQTRGVDYGPENVVVTPGAKPIIFFGLIACVEPGDEVIYPDPAFPIYESMVNFLGAKPVPLRLREERGFSVDVDELKSLLTDKTRFLILNSPANPTGGTIPREDLAAIADLVRERDLWVLSDEIYSRILYEGEHHSITQFPGMKEKTIILDGHSKTYAMTGWRLGYGVMPVELANHMTRLMTNSNSCCNVFVQRAGMKALQGPQDEVDAMVAEFKRRRDVIVDGLNAIPGVQCLRPKGAFYAFPNVADLDVPTRQLASDLLEKAGVACLSGTAFGPGGDGYLRFSYANSVQNIETALSRIRGYFEEAGLRP